MKFSDLFKRYPGAGTGKDNSEQSGLDARLNWNLRSQTTVTGPTSAKPDTMSPSAEIGSSGQNATPIKPPVNVPYQNYYDLSQPVPGRMQYIRAYQDNTPINFRREMGDVSGVSNVQLVNPVATTTRKRIVLYTAAGYLWAVVPRIPGQTRDNFGGFHARGIDPISYRRLWTQGPGSQPVNPGGPAKIAGRSYQQPGMVGGINNMMYGAGS